MFNTDSVIAISERTCRESLQRFKNGEFDIEVVHGDGREVSQRFRIGGISS